MTEETLALSDAPEPIETTPEEATAEAEVLEVAEVEEEQKGDEPSESSTETVQEKKPDPVQARIDELTKLRRTAERDAEYWREQAQRKEPEKPVEVIEETVKTLADFDYDEGKYQQHLIAKAKAEAVDEAKRVLRDEQGQQAVNQRISEFRGREAEFSKEIEDYVDVVQNPNLAISQPMADVAMEMDNGPEVLYYLGKNPDLAIEIANLPPLLAARELGRIEATLSNKESGKTVSEAPAPTPKLKAVEHTTKKPVDEMSQREWNEYRRKQIAKRGR